MLLQLKLLLCVFLVLSTVATVAVCCSSRVILVERQTLKLINKQQNIKQTTVDTLLVPSNANTTELEINFQHNLSPPPVTAEKLNDSSLILEESAVELQLNDLAPNADLTTSTMLPLGGGGGGSVDDGTTSSSTVPLIDRIDAEHANNDTNDFYYKIMRDVLSFGCDGQYLTDFCLNGGRCFRYPVGNHSFFSCECADGYIGERCESKSINDVYTPSHAHLEDARKKKILMARIIFSFPMLVILSTIYTLLSLIIVFRKLPFQCHKTTFFVQR